MSVEVAVVVSVLVLGFSVVLGLLAKALGKNAETLREVIADQNRLIEDANSEFVRLCSESSDKAHAFSEEYRELYHTKVEAIKNEQRDAVVLTADERTALNHHRELSKMEEALKNPPPNPAEFVG